MLNLTLKVKANQRPNHRDLNQGVLHILSDTERRTDTHTQTDVGNDNTWMPKLASGKKQLKNRDMPNLI